MFFLQTWYIVVRLPRELYSWVHKNKKYTLHGFPLYIKCDYFIFFQDVDRRAGLSVQF